MLSNDMGRRGVVGYPINPGLQRTARFVFLQAQPERKMNLLKQIFPFIGIRFVGSRYPLHGGAVTIDCFLVKTLLCAHGHIVVRERAGVTARFE